VVVDDRDQMGLVGKFLWLPWAKCRTTVERRSEREHLHYWEGAHDGYQSLRAPVRHRRAVLKIDDHGWIVLDRLQSVGEHDYRLHWLLAPTDHAWFPERRELELELPHGSYRVIARCGSERSVSRLVCRDEKSPRGWIAPWYNSLQAALSLDVTVREQSVWFCTCFTSEICSLKLEERRVSLAASGWELRIDLSGGGQSLAERVWMSGDGQEDITLAV
jgi:hypothetical protein